MRNEVLKNCLEEPETLVTDYRVLEGEEFVQELVRKIAEEASEIPTTPEADPKEVLSEIADLQSVVDALRDHFGFSEVEIQAEAKRKADKKGDFTGRYYIDSVVLADNSPWIDYFLAEPERYPEE